MPRRARLCITNDIEFHSLKLVQHLCNVTWFRPLTLWPSDCYGPPVGTARGLGDIGRRTQEKCRRVRPSDPGRSVDVATQPLSRENCEALPCLVKGGEPISIGLTAPHLAWKEPAFSFVCDAVPFPIGRVRRKGGSISGTFKPLVAAAIRVSAAVAIWMGRRARRVVPISELVFGALTQNRSSLEDRTTTRRCHRASGRRRVST
jgi:hypothetical protein